MCNIGGYIGNENAASVLLEMMEKQEGFGGGHYSGIATLHEGKIYHAKVVGNFATLRKETDAEKFPGNIGIAHSRPGMGGDREWAHPFVNDTETMVYLVNGHPGFFEDAENEKKILKKLLNRGQKFRTASENKRAEHSSYPILPDGKYIHASELMCHYISFLMDENKKPVNAMRNAFVTYPAEIAGLCLFKSMPDKIIASRFNQPMMLGFSKNAAYMASTAMAFPENKDIEIINPMPVSCTAVISKTGMELFPFKPIHGRVANVFPYSEACEIILKTLSKDDGRTLQDLKNATAPLWARDAASQKDMLVYEIIRGLYSRDRITCKDFIIEGMNGTMASQKKIYLKQE
ncbi:MAG: hypothetical protein A2017_02785 [Lentisphaerae bacterium GWF2_44_16]|nr:MAG: hypothetical protein A2017_02785 [Lentisphaerae bacterium GWF2_44_16]